MFKAHEKLTYESHAHTQEASFSCPFSDQTVKKDRKFFNQKNIFKFTFLWPQRCVNLVVWFRGFSLQRLLIDFDKDQFVQETHF